MNKRVVYRVLLMQLGMIIGAYSSIFAHGMLHEASTHTAHAVINKHDFVAQRDVVDGKLREEWRIDGHIVDHDSYYSAMAEARAIEYKNEMLAERQSALEKVEQREKLRKKVARKIIHADYEAIKAMIARIHDYDIELHLQWHDTTIPSRQEYDCILSKTLPDLLEQASQKESDYELLSAISHEVEGYSHRFDALIKRTIDYLVEHCSDTKILKKLLEYLE